MPTALASFPRAHLFVAMSCATPLDAPSRHGIDGLDEVRIGRGARRGWIREEVTGRTSLTLTLSDRHVSLGHARIVRKEGAWIFEDLGSKNGSLVNGVVAQALPLTDGDCLQIGHSLLIFRSALPTPPNAPLDLEAQARVPVLATLVPALARDLNVLSTAALSKVPILLTSETGTGKELLARALHALSRRKGDFVAVNCGGLPAALAESVLFGHRRGAFSGAVADHPGLFHASSGGTLLLDESATCRWPSRPQSSGLCKTAKCFPSVPPVPCTSTSVSSRRRTVNSTSWWPRDAFAKTSWRGSLASDVGCRRYESGARISGC